MTTGGGGGVGERGVSVTSYNSIVLYGKRVLETNNKKHVSGFVHLSVSFLSIDVVSTWSKLMPNVCVKYK
jgi:hypothetical protein